MIRWTTREWRLIAERLVSQNVNPDLYGWRSNIIEAMRQALPLDRWREPHSLNETKKILKPIMAEVTRLSTQPEQLLRTSEAKSEPQNKLTTEFLLVELAKRLAAWLERSHGPVYAPVDRGFHPKHDPSAPAEYKVSLPRILIIGPRGEQQARLLRAFPHLNLRFVTCEDNPSRCAVGVVDEAILWTKFMSHAQQDAVKALGYTTWYANSMEEIDEHLRAKY